MFGFQYYTPTKVVFGRETEKRTPELIREFLQNNGFDIVFDEVIEDKKKKYQIYKGVRH